MTELSPEFAKEARKTARGEVPFQAADLFYTRTDPRGVIESASMVFQRLGGFEWDEILGAPHKLVRHADMPRGLFHLLWGRLKSGKQTGYYVKNMDADGRHYWVFGVVSPIEGGFLSTYFKPLSPLREKVETIYAKAHAAETDGLSPEDSAAQIAADLAELGYPTYDVFHSAALSEEWDAKKTYCGDALDPLQKRFVALSASIAQVQAETMEMTDAFKAIRTVPLNMRIIASRLENAGGPISAISVNYSQMLEEMSTWVKTFVDGEESVFALIRNAILRVQFLGFASALYGEMQAALKKEEFSEEVGVDAEAEVVALQSLTEEFMQETRKALTRVETEAGRLGRSVLDMKRYVTGLSSTRMMCKIESASLSNSGTALTGIVDQLDACQDEIEERLARIVDQNAVIQSHTAMLRTLI
ncbi:PAS domain-containing protein [Cognatishimia sp. F0-27]|uniref:PAS domain-containing protein n=1 Tax=Cognatishimia sp. F0-27 TaxID=2816855 RepID=UPI001D0CBCA8|nr:PAS domain-containing protein [Cognatishimia sp. F0-27]MCC1491943.1 chemotaxis protein [Cognatishimia sp. F0-27]